MEKQVVKILSVEKVTHDVVMLKMEKPAAVDFKPGQAVRLTLNKPGFEERIRPVTISSLPDDDHIEMIVKGYTDHDGVTQHFLDLKAGDELNLLEVFGAITYKGNGLFIAGGTGVTPFISIFRQLAKADKIGGNKLIFASKTEADIILKDELETLLGENCIHILSQEEKNGYLHGRITQHLLRDYIDGHQGYVYVCGPDEMVDTLEMVLLGLGVDEEHIVREE